MKKLVSNPVRNLQGTARVPGDKSVSHRALMLGALCHGETVVEGLLEGEDVLNTAAALTAMGVGINNVNKVWRIEGLGGGNFKSPAKDIYLGNSGTSARLLMGLIAGYPIKAVFTGDESLSRRPMGRVIKPLTQMGVTFESENDKMPVRITGSAPLQAIRYELPVASAQVKSAVLLAGLRAAGKTIVIEKQPTRDHTERMLSFMGGNVVSEMQPEGSCIVTVEGYPKLEARRMTVPSDPSSAAFLTVAALITKGSDILIPGVMINPRRTGLYETLMEMGADITFENKIDNGCEPVADIRVRSSALKGVTVPASRAPSMIDEFPVLSVAAAFAEGKTVMTGLAELRVKESDRLLAIAKGLAAAGVRAETGEESLTVYGSGGVAPVGGCTVETNMDHRIAMSFLVLGMGAKESVAVDGADMIATSFPGFANLMNSLGSNIYEKD